MTSEYVPDVAAFRGVYGQMCAEWCRDDALAEFDRFIARVKAEAWDEGAEHAWRSTGEGFNGEYVCGHGTHDGAISFRQVRAEDDRDDNPYREEAGL